MGINKLLVARLAWANDPRAEIHFMSSELADLIAVAGAGSVGLGAMTAHAGLAKARGNE